MQRAVAFVPDLMDRSRFDGMDHVSFVALSGLVEAAARADVVVVDLGRPGALDAVADVSALGVRVIGFGSHVDADLLEQARAAGCDQVLARSRFFADLHALLA